MSNVPKARRVIQLVLSESYLAPTAKRRLRYALVLMKRRRYPRRATRRREKIDAVMKKKIRFLVRTTDLTYHQIANRCGLRSSGRVSEVVHGKR